jgi:hypothetical protein
MLHTRTLARSPRLPLGGTLAALTLTLAACAGAAAGPSATPGSTSGPGATPQPTPTAVAGDPGGGNGGGTDPGGGGGGTGGNPGTGVLPPGITFPIAPVPDESLLGEAKYLSPVKGLVNTRTSNIQLLRAVVAEDGKAFADLRWYSGVEPCNSLDSVQVVTDDAAKTIHLTVIEGSAPGDQMCIELAELHAVAVDLGVLAAGTWTISAEGDAPAIKLDVP